MPAHDKHARTAARLMADTGSASASVVSARLLAFSNPFDFMSRHQQREVSKMVSEKVKAGFDGWMAASAEMVAMPFRLLQATARPSAFTPVVAMETWMALGGLWIGVGNAALRPARNTVMANHARLRHDR
jgi:hypothetical protein